MTEHKNSNIAIYFVPIQVYEPINKFTFIKMEMFQKNMLIY